MVSQLQYDSQESMYEVTQLCFPDSISHNSCYLYDFPYSQENPNKKESY
jgi:hypothetical protein